MRFVVLTGRVFLAAALLTFIVVIVRRFLVLRFDFDFLPYGSIGLVLAVAAGYLLIPVIVRLTLFLRRPPAERVARTLDARLGLDDLLASGMTASGMSGETASTVVRQAATAAGGLEPGRLFPAKRSIARTLAVLPLLLAAAWLLGLPVEDGYLLVSGTGETGIEDAPSEEAVPGEEEPGESEPEAKTEPDPTEPEVEEPKEEEPPPAEFAVRVVPSKKVFEPDEPVIVFLLADSKEELGEEITFDTGLILDGDNIATGETVTIKTGPKGGGMVVLDLKKIEACREHLKGGKHQVSGVLIGPGGAMVGPPAEFEIRGDDSDGGGGGEPPPPEPQPPEPEPQEGPGAPPPPPLATKPRFVTPLFDEGETVKKKGWALVPDPEAPAGSAPRRLPLDEAAREASKRPESAVPVERLGVSDAATVARYFELLRQGR